VADLCSASCTSSVAPGCLPIMPTISYAGSGRRGYLAGRVHLRRPRAAAGHRPSQHGPVLVFGLAGDGSDQQFGTFVAFTLVPQGFLLPVLGILLVTQEWASAPRS
jgi:hypothetical protein